MIREGVELMTIGMGVVFGYLLFLVLAMTASAKFFSYFENYFPAAHEEDGHLEKRAAGDNANIALVVAIAHAFAQRREEESCNG